MRALILLISIFFIGCATAKPAFHSKMDGDSVYIDPYNSWVNNCSSDGVIGDSCKSPWRSITIRVINKKYTDVFVSVQCKFELTETLFGKATKKISSRNDGVVFIRGLARMVPDKDRVICGISEVN